MVDFLTEYKTFFESLGALFIVLGAGWTVLKLRHRHRENFIFITNCHLLPLTFWEEYVKRANLKTDGEHDHAFRPIMFLPRACRGYVDLPAKGGDVTLESCVDNERLCITCQAYWIPEDMEPWCKLEYPMLSLVIRRFLQIERPLFQDDDTAPKGWVRVSHPAAQLAPLHKRDPQHPGHLIWACSDHYTFRFRNPALGRYTDANDDEAIIEYCGLSLKLRPKSIFVID